MSWKDRAIKVEPGQNSSSWRDRARPVGQPRGEILNERAPEISFGDRAIAKNLAQSTQKQVEFLKAQYPGIEISQQGNDILVKGKDGNFRKLDPSTLELEDITDLGEAVIGGITSSLGAAGGGIAGALAGGAGAVPGALAGTALAGSATEALRQRLGRALGIPQEVDTGDVVMSGAANLAGSALLGTGLKEGAKGAYKGLVRGAWNKGLPAMAKMWTGATDDVIRAYSDPAQRELIDSLSQGGKTEFTDDLVTRIGNALNQEKKKIGGALSESIQSSGDQISIARAKESLMAEVQRLDELAARIPSQENVAAAQEAKKTLLSVIQKADGSGLIDDTVNPSDIMAFQDSLKDIGQLRKAGGGLTPRYGNQATSTDKSIANAGLSAYRAVNDEMDRVTQGVAPELKKQYGALKDLESALSPSLRGDQTAYNAFTGLDNRGKVMFKEALENLEKKTGEKFKDDIVKLQAADYFGSGSWMPKSIGGTTSTSRTVPAAIIGGVIGGKVGGAMGAPMLGAAAGLGLGNASASPQALKYLIRNTDAMRSGANQIGNMMDYGYTTPLIRETLVQSPWFEMGE